MFKQKDKARRLLWAMILCFTLFVAIFNQTSIVPGANAANGWTDPVNLLPKSVYPAVAVRPADGDVFEAGGGCAGINVVDTKNNNHIIPIAANRAGCNAGHVSLAFDRASNLYVTWQDRADSGYFNVFYSKVTPGGQVSTPRDLSVEVGVKTGLVPSVYTSLAPNSDNHLYIGFEISKYNANGDANGADVAVIDSSNGGQSWGNLTYLGSVATAGVSGTRMIVDNNNNPHLIFSNGPDVIDRDYNNGWGPAVKVDTQGTGGNRAFWPAVAIGLNGDIFTAWQEDLGAGSNFGTAIISLARWDHNSRLWQPEVRNVSQNKPGHVTDLYPAITVGSEGNVWVAWDLIDTKGSSGVAFSYSLDNAASFIGPNLAISQSYVRAGFDNLASFNGQIYLAVQLDNGSGFGNYLSSAASRNPIPQASPGTAPNGCQLPSWAAATTVPGSTTNLPSTDSSFFNTWARYDYFAAGNRSYVWGPTPFAAGTEPYFQATDSNGKNSQYRQVLYWDKSRMEITKADGDKTSLGYVTNGLLTVELVTGRLQIGDNGQDPQQFIQCNASQIPVAGDANDTTGPRYAGFASRMNDPAIRVGDPVIQTIAADGGLGVNGAISGVYPNVKGGYYEPTTKHTIANVFWDFLNQGNQQIWTGSNTSSFGKLFNPYYYVPGLPISEAYWAKVKVGGQTKDVLIQAFERRVLTYTPTNPDPFKVEWGNIGRHYYQWRYSKS